MSPSRAFAGGRLGHGFDDGFVRDFRRALFAGRHALETLAERLHEVDDLRRRFFRRTHHFAAFDLGVDDLAQLFLILVFVLRQIAARLEVADDLTRQRFPTRRQARSRVRRVPRLGAADRYRR